MAGIGIKLNKIYNKNSITTNLIGFGYSMVITIAPMVVVIGAIFLMGRLLGLDKIGYAQREVFSCTVLYVFIFSLLITTPFNAVISRYLSDTIYEERYEDILPCFHIGAMLTLIVSTLMGVPFCVHECLVGGVPLYYVFTGYCCFIALVMVFYSMMYLSICKDYQKISLFFFLGMAFSVLLSWLIVTFLHWEVTYVMLFSLTAGFLLTAGLEMAIVRSYFRENSGNYRSVLKYFAEFKGLAFTNLFYTLGMYVHNFVFWGTEMRTVVVNTFVCAEPYDLATCIAMFTNISATVIFTTRVEMYFHARYKAYSEAVIGGRLMDVENAKKRMFIQLGGELMSLVRMQFIVSVVLYLLCMIFLPMYGFSGLTLKIYPCLAVGYFILFIMYSAIMFLYYFNDLLGSFLTAFSFFVVTLVSTVYTSQMSPIWYGLGVVVGSFVGWTVAYIRLRWVERNLDIHIFCKGQLMKPGRGHRPSSKVMDRRTGKMPQKA